MCGEIEIIEVDNTLIGKTVIITKEGQDAELLLNTVVGMTAKVRATAKYGGWYLADFGKDIGGHNGASAQLKTPISTDGAGWWFHRDEFEVVPPAKKRTAKKLVEVN
jgi:hypothetical protein